MTEYDHGLTEKKLRADADKFRKETGYGLAPVYGAIQQGELWEAYVTLNELMALNYRTEHGY